MTIQTFPSLIGLSYPVTRAPVWQTIIQKAISGKETRLQLWTYPRWKWELSFDYLGSNASNAQNQDWQAFVGFFNSLGGSALPFHWNDPYDNAVTLQQLGEGDGTTTKYNFIRALGGFIEPVQDVQTISAVTVDGTPTAAYTLLTDPNWGLTYGIQFNSAPANGKAIKASFTYDWACRLDDDTVDMSNYAFAFWELKKLAFTSAKVL